MKTKFYQINWSWNRDIDDLFAKKFEGYTILNFPCGMSKIGFRADMDPKVKPDIFMDLMNHDFKPNSFEVVICDPPFQYFNHFKWLLKIKDIASKYFVVCTPCNFITLKGFSDPEIIAARGGRTGGSLFLRFFFIYKKLNQNLPSWTDFCAQELLK